MAVYFIDFPQMSAIKVGYAESPLKRMAELQTASPGTLRMIGWVGGSMEDERAFHRKLVRYRIRGEWFRDTEDVRDVIRDALSAEGTPSSIKNITSYEVREAICAQVLDSISPFLLRRLAREIAMTAEKSYRRGYQHGYVLGTGDHKSDVSYAISRWRFDYTKDVPKEGIEKATFPPETRMPKERDFGISIYSRAEESASTIGAQIVAAIMDEIEMTKVASSESEGGTVP